MPDLERRWHAAWPAWAPKTLTVEKPVSEYLRDWAARAPDRIALSFYGRDLTYGELNAAVDALAAALVDLGVRRGDRVALHLQNCPQFPLTYFAAQRAGAAAVPVSPMFKSAELAHELCDSGAETIIGLDTLYPEVEKIRARTSLRNVVLTSLGDYLPESPVLEPPAEALLPRRRFAGTLELDELAGRPGGVPGGGAPGRAGTQPGGAPGLQAPPLCRVDDLEHDLSLLQYTGGTSGTPKGAMITHRALASAVLGSVAWHRLTERDVLLGAAPFFHVMGQVNLMCAAAVCGGRLVVLSRFDPRTAAEAVVHYGVTAWVAATPMLIGLLDLPGLESYDVSSLRFVTTGGTSISAELQARLARVAPQVAVVEGYGLSETASTGGACTPHFKHRPGFVGIPQIGVDMKIVDRDTGTVELPPGQEGEILIKAPSMMTGYWNNPEETAEVLRDGWLRTGDIGLMDDDGYLKLLGRSRELIKCSGFSVFPAEVEGLLYAHPAVKEAAVIGVSDPYRGESPKAFVVLKEEYVGTVTEQDILDWCRDNMAAYKRPRHVEFRTGLPHSSAGKLLRRALDGTGGGGQ